MSRRLSRPAAWLVVALAAGLLALPACKKKQPSKPDSTPEPNQNTNPNENTGPGASTTNVPVEPGMPSPPTQRPMFTTAIVGAGTRTTSQDNLHQIALAFHNYNDTNGSFPAGIADKSGKVGLSWRVAILPYVEQQALYNMFKLDEPWDSEHNKKLITKMPAVYAPTRNPSDMNGWTFYRSFTGPGTLMQPPAGPLQAGQPVRGPRMPAGIPDGTSNTFLAVEAYDPVIWTKPDDLPYAPGKPPRLGGGVYRDRFYAAMCDGSVRSFPTSTSPQSIQAYITINGGEVVVE